MGLSTATNIYYLHYLDGSGLAVLVVLFMHCKSNIVIEYTQYVSID